MHSTLTSKASPQGPGWLLFKSYLKGHKHVFKVERNYKKKFPGIIQVFHPDIIFTASQKCKMFHINSCHLQMFTNCFLGSWQWDKVQECNIVGLLDCIYICTFPHHSFLCETSWRWSLSCTVHVLCTIWLKTAHKAFRLALKEVQRHTALFHWQVPYEKAFFHSSRKHLRSHATDRAESPLFCIWCLRDGPFFSPFCGPVSVFQLGFWTLLCLALSGSPLLQILSV